MWRCILKKSPFLRLFVLLTCLCLSFAVWGEQRNESEPNNEREQANELRLDKEITGHINPQNDEDWYVATIPQPGLEIFVIELSGVSGVNSKFGLYDSKGEELKEADNRDEGEKEVMVRMKVKPGKYFIRVYGDNANAEAAYTLLAHKSTAPPATDEEVREALARALAYLADKQTSEGYWLGSYEESPGIAGLALMAYLGGECVPKDYSAKIASAMKFIKTKYHPSSDYKPGSEDSDYYGGLIYKSNEMYEHAIAILALIEAFVILGESSLEPIIEDALNLITRVQNSEHKPKSLGGPINSDSEDYGGWRYRPNSTDSDISVTGWQILALKAAMNAGFSVPDWSIQKAANYLRACYDKDEKSFGYTPGGKGTCARAGIGVLGLQLLGFPNDPLIPPAIRYMQDNAPTWEFEDPGDGWPFYYWYYGTRAMLIGGGDDWRLWKSWICRLLVDHQNEDGSWDGAQREEGMEVYTTSLGALMLELCCGHLPVYMAKGVEKPATVEVLFEKEAEKELAKNVELILDCSNSMWGQIGKEAKIIIARNVLGQIINGLPEKMNVGLRLYGHRYEIKDQRACTDTELIAAIGPLKKMYLIETINKINPKGKTPLVYSVLEAVKDFEKIAKGTIILISDGIESCNGDINSIAPALKEAGFELKVHIVGFDIKEAEARKELEAIAESTGGKYLDAKDSGELLSALEQTLQIEFALLDEKGEIRATGFVGRGPVKVKPGNYTLRLMLEPKPLETKITVTSGGKSMFVLSKKEGIWNIR